MKVVEALHVVGSSLESGVGVDLVLRILDLVRDVMHFDAQLIRPLRHLSLAREAGLLSVEVSEALFGVGDLLRELLVQEEQRFRRVCTVQNLGCRV